MNKQTITIIGIITIVVIGGVIVMSQQPSQTTTLPEPTAMQKKDDAMMEKKEDTMMEKDNETVMANAGTYTTYSPSMYEETKGMKRVLFFHATWCPTCKAANNEFMERASEIPKGVVLLKTDYDQEKELKKKYGITYQHTFVQIDDEGNELAKWNGGGIAELTANVK